MIRESRTLTTLTLTGRRLVAGGLVAALGAGMVALVAAGAPAVRLRASTAVRAVAPPRAAIDAPSRHVVIVSVDGLRPEAIARDGAHTMGRLAREGAASLDARTILPSLTLPSHTSMLTGVVPARHGITWNDERVSRRGVVAVPTVFAIARAHGLETAAFFSKNKFRHLMVPGSLDYAQAPRSWWGWGGHWRAERTARDVRRFLERGARPNLLFVHLGEPDYAGHDDGWDTPAYGRAVRSADMAVGEVAAAAERAFGRGRFTLIVTADHGGHGRGHGSADPRDVRIPWIAWGEGVARSASLPSGIRTMDTAATALWLLGVPVPAAWDGRPVLPAFGAPDTARIHRPASARR